MIDKLIKWIVKFWDSSQYTKEYFIEFFENIKEENIGVGMYQYCALWHLGGEDYPYDNERINALADLLMPYAKKYRPLSHIVGIDPIWMINDHPSYPGGSPRQRILTALKSL